MRGKKHENLDCRNHKMEAANKVERLASRIKVRGTSPPESEKRRASNQEENLEMVPMYLKDA